MFHFSTFAPCSYTFRARYPEGWVAPFGYPRITVWLPTPLGFSQVPASFIASRHQVIHRVPLCLVIPTGRRDHAASYPGSRPDRPWPSRFAGQDHPDASQGEHVEIADNAPGLAPRPVVASGLPFGTTRSSFGVLRGTLPPAPFTRPASRPASATSPRYHPSRGTGLNMATAETPHKAGTPSMRPVHQGDTSSVSGCQRTASNAGSPFV